MKGYVREKMREITADRSALRKCRNAVSAGVLSPISSAVGRNGAVGDKRNARAGARNYPHRRQRKRSHRGAKLSPAETNTTLTLLRGDTSSAPFGGTCLPVGRSVRGSDTPPACHSIPRTHQGGRLGGGGGRSEKCLPWLRQAAASASAPVSVHAVLLTDNSDERLCPRENAANHCRV